MRISGFWSSKPDSVSTWFAAHDHNIERCIRAPDLVRVRVVADFSFGEHSSRRSERLGRHQWTLVRKYRFRIANGRDRPKRDTQRHRQNEESGHSQMKTLKAADGLRSMQARLTSRSAIAGSLRRGVRRGYPPVPQRIGFGRIQRAHRLGSLSDNSISQVISYATPRQCLTQTRAKRRWAAARPRGTLCSRRCAGAFCAVLSCARGPHNRAHHAACPRRAETRWQWAWPDLAQSRKATT